MKKLTESLMPNEQLIKEAEFTKIGFVPGIVFLIFFVFGSFSAESVGDAFILIFGGIVWAALISIPAIRLLLSNCLAITDKKVFGRVGIIKTAEMNSPIHQIQNVSVSNGLFGKLFKYGTVVITTTTGVYAFKYVKNPDQFKNEVMAQITRTEESKMDLHAQKIADAIYRTNH